MLNLNINLQRINLKKHDFKPQTLDSKDLKRIFDRCIGQVVTLDYVYKNRIATYSCTVHDKSCNVDECGCNVDAITCKKLQGGCIRITAFKAMQPKVAPCNSISIPCNSSQLMRVFKNVCFETRDFYIYVSCKNLKIDIRYCFKNKTI